MRRATAVRPAGEWAGPPADVVTLDLEGRHRRRVAMQGEGGLRFLLDLPEAVRIRDGDGLLLEGGGIVAVRAAPEPLLAAHARDPHHLARLAWHLGNRHVPARIEPERLLLRRDHVLADMLRHLGAEVVEVEGPFEPEAGAFAGGHRHD